MQLFQMVSNLFRLIFVPFMSAAADDHSSALKLIVFFNKKFQ